MIQFCGEIAYERNDGTVHSDICFDCGNTSKTKHKLTNEHREFLHECLDEWLDKSKGTGAFWIGDWNYLRTELNV